MPPHDQISHADYPGRIDPILAGLPRYRAGRHVRAPLYGLDSRPVDGTVFEMRRADGRGFLVGAPCRSDVVTPCVAIPVGIQRLVNRLRALDAQQLATPWCKNAGF